MTHNTTIPNNKLSTILDFDTCKSLVHDAISKDEPCAILCPQAPGQWTIIDAESTRDHPGKILVPIGPKYKSKFELLADIENFAKERGYIS